LGRREPASNRQKTPRLLTGALMSFDPSTLLFSRCQLIESERAANEQEPEQLELPFDGDLAV